MNDHIQKNFVEAQKHEGQCPLAGYPKTFEHEKIRQAERNRKGKWYKTARKHEIKHWTWQQKGNTIKKNLLYKLETIDEQGGGITPSKHPFLI